MGWLTDDMKDGYGKQECPKCWKRAVVENNDGSHDCEKCGWTDKQKKQDSWLSW